RPRSRHRRRTGPPRAPRTGRSGESPGGPPAQGCHCAPPVDNEVSHPNPRGPFRALPRILSEPMVTEAPRPNADEAAAGGDGSIRLLEGDPLDPLVQSQCSLSVQLRRATGSIVARSTELQSIAQSIREAKGHLAAVTLEGEPGIGKTRLLVATAELTEAAGFTTVAITADEEIRGPFLVARSLFANGAIRECASGTRAEVALRRVVEALAGRDEPGFENLSPEAKLLR